MDKWKKLMLAAVASLALVACSTDTGTDDSVDDPDVEDSLDESGMETDGMKDDDGGY